MSSSLCLAAAFCAQREVLLILSRPGEKKSLHPRNKISETYYVPGTILGKFKHAISFNLFDFISFLISKLTHAHCKKRNVNMTLDKLYNLSELQLPLLSNGNKIYIILWVLMPHYITFRNNHYYYVGVYSPASR